MENNEREISYQEAADELGKKLMKLYNEKFFPRMGKEFADMLFKTGIEAGAYLASLSEIEERFVKRDMAQNALVRLKRVAYILDLMQNADLYTKAQIIDLREFLDALIVAMRNVLASAYAKLGTDAQRRAVPVSKPVTVAVPVHMQKPIAVPAKSAQVAAPAAPKQTITVPVSSEEIKETAVEATPIVTQSKVDSKAEAKKAKAEAKAAKKADKEKAEKAKTEKAKVKPAEPEIDVSNLADGFDEVAGGGFDEPVSDGFDEVAPAAVAPVEITVNINTEGTSKKDEERPEDSKEDKKN